MQKKLQMGLCLYQVLGFFRVDTIQKPSSFLPPPPPQFENLNVGRSQKISSVITFNFT